LRRGKRSLAEEELQVLPLGLVEFTFCFGYNFLKKSFTFVLFQKKKEEEKEKERY